MDWLRQTLDDLATRGLLRRPVTVEGRQGPQVRVDGRDVLCFCSNNYLGLADHPALAEAAKGAIDAYGTGAGASRLVSGTMAIHRELEAAIARFEGTEAALVFPTGYMANVGTISSLVGRGDTVFSDRLNHASIVDGCRLSGATFRVYPHKDVERLDRLLAKPRGGRTLVVSDTVFSMDGDIAPVVDLLDTCERHGAMLMLDEAHATGVIGSAECRMQNADRVAASGEREVRGAERGRASAGERVGGAANRTGDPAARKRSSRPPAGDPGFETGNPKSTRPSSAPLGIAPSALCTPGSPPSTPNSPLLLMGTLSKAVGSVGGFVAGSRDLVELLVNRARSFIYTTAPPPGGCAASLAGLRIIESEPERRQALWGRARQLQDGLRERGFDIGATETPITPLIAGESDAAVTLSARLLERGILAPAIRPPTVAKGTARLRLTPIATHTEADITSLLDAIDDAAPAR
jgi:glycine C-acetyltransferase